MLLRSGWCCYRSIAEFDVREPPDPSRLKSYNQIRLATPISRSRQRYVAFTVQPREPTEQIADNERASDGGKWTRAYRGACRLGQACLCLLRLVGNGRRPFGRRGRGVGGGVDCMVGSSAEAVNLRGRLLRDLVRCLMRCLRHAFHLGAERISEIRAAAESTHACRGSIHDRSFRGRCVDRAEDATS